MLGLIESIDIRKIRQSNIQVRRDIGEIGQFARSIQENGLLQPIVVRPKGPYFEIVAGNRRFVACKKLLFRRIPCHVVELTDKKAYEISLIENIQRRTMSPIEEAEAYKRYVDDYGWGGITELAKTLGRSQEYVSKRLKLLELPKSIQEDVIRRRIKASTAEELAYIENKEEQSRLAKMIVVRNLTLRKLREMNKNGSEIQTTDSVIELTRSHDSIKHELALAAFDKSIVALKLTLNRLDDIIEALGDNWPVDQLLNQNRQVIHSQVDKFLHEKKKYSKIVGAHLI